MADKSEFFNGDKQLIFAALCLENSLEKGYFDDLSLIDCVELVLNLEHRLTCDADTLVTAIDTLLADNDPDEDKQRTPGDQDQLIASVHSILGGDIDDIKRMSIDYCCRVIEADARRNDDTGEYSKILSREPHRKLIVAVREITENHG